MSTEDGYLQLTRFRYAGADGKSRLDCESVQRDSADAARS